MFFFTEPEKITQIASPYGPLDANRYQITTRCVFQDTAKAFACQNGQIVVVPGNAPDRVTVVLKPDGVLDIPFSTPRYYIYRGILISSFFTADGKTVTPAGADNTDFLKNVWERVHAWQNLHVNTDTVTPFSFGYMSNLPDVLNVEQLFVSGAPDAPGVLPTMNRVKEGTWFGDFGKEGGFEIVTDPEDIQISMGYLKLSDMMLDLTKMPANVTGDPAALRIAKELILHFIDPAAFYGLHYSKGFYVFDSKEQDRRKLLTKDQINKAALTKFPTKNRMYLDIRSERGYSYNFYLNYGDEENNNFKTKHPADADFTARRYESEWPIFKFDFGNNEQGSTSKFTIKLRIDDNEKPLLFAEDEATIPEGFGKNFIGHEMLVNGNEPDWTNSIVLKLNNTEDPSDPSKRVYMATYLKLQYFRQKEAPASSPSAITKGNKPNGLFGGIGNFFMSDGTVGQSYKNTKKIFINGDGYGYVAETGIHYDKDRVMLYARSLYAHEPSELLYPVVNPEAIRPPLLDCPGFPNRIVFNSWKQTTDGAEVKLTEIAGYTENAKETPKENLFLLGLTKAEFATLVSSASSALTNAHAAYLTLEQEIPAAAGSRHYQRYSVKLTGLDSGGKQAVATTPVKILSSSSRMFCSNEFTAPILDSYTAQDPVIFDNEWDFAAKIELNPQSADSIIAGHGVIIINDPQLNTVNKVVAHSEARPVPISSISLFPSDAADGSISARFQHYPLVMIIPGNGHLFTDYEHLCRHLALNGFIASAIDCRYTPINRLTMKEVDETELILAGYEKQVFYWTDRFVYQSSPARLDKVEYDEQGKIQTTPTGWEIGADYKVSADMSEMELLNPPPSHGMSPVGRSMLIAEHLKFLEKLFGSALDKSRIGLLGHSRGGEGIFRTGLGLDPTPGFKIAALMSLAPTDQIPMNLRKDFTNDIPSFHLYGSRDGDVSGTPSDIGMLHASAFSLYDRSDNKSMRSMAFVKKATHNGFNTNNHDYPDYIRTLIEKVPQNKGRKLSDDDNVLLSPSLQKQMLRGYASAFFRMTLRAESVWKPVFVGDWTPPSFAAGGHLGVAIQYQPEDGMYKMIADFEDQPSDNIAHPETWIGIGVLRDVPDKLLKTGTSADTSLDPFSPHSTKGATVEWTAGKKWTIPFPKGSATGKKYLSFRIATHLNFSGKVLSNTQIVLDSYSVSLNKYGLIPEIDIRPDLIQPLGPQQTWNEHLNTKAAMMTVRIPLESFTKDLGKLDSADRLAFIFPNTGDGRADIDTIQFTL